MLKIIDGVVQVNNEEELKEAFTAQYAGMYISMPQDLFVQYFNMKDETKEEVLN
jgi:hypothetical protein